MEAKPSRILVVDDEEDLCEILQYNLREAGYLVDVAYSAEETLLKPIKDYDLFLLDVMMGKISGFELASKIRKELNISTPIIFLTAKDTENDLLTGFNLGADDYIAKPFSMNELIARVKAVLKRTQNEKKSNKDIIEVGKIKIDKTRKRLIIDDSRIEITKKEFKILMLLVENQGKVFTRDDLLHLVWGDDIVVSDRTVDVNITRLRNKLGQYGKYLKNKTGFGYFFEIEI